MKIGILGTGNISEKVAPTLAAMEEIECWAAASRSLPKAKAFAERHGFQRAYGSYEELAEDPQVELIYVATPHSCHYENMMLCLSHGKPVLCEKPFTVNAAQAREVQKYAAARGLFAAEAMWTRYMPSRAMIGETLASGIIGRPTVLTANLSYANFKRQRLVDPALAGGALLDLGVYGLNFARMHFGGGIERVDSSVCMTETGVDGMENITLSYRDGRMAVLTHGIWSRSDRRGTIWGDRGYLVVENINNPQNISVYDTEDRLLQRYDVPQQISGYEYEFREAVRCIREGRRESASMPLEETIAVTEQMDALRRQWGLVYPCELPGT